MSSPAKREKPQKRGGKQKSRLSASDFAQQGKKVQIYLGDSQRKNRTKAPSRVIGSGQRQRVASERAYLSQLQKQILAPELVTDKFVVSPNTPAYGVAVRHFKRVVEYDQGSYPNLRISMNPNLFAPSYVSSVIARNFPAAGTGSVNVSGEWHYTTAGEIDKSSSRVISDNTEFLTTTVPIADSAALVHSGFNLTPTVAQVFNFYMKDHTPKKAANHVVHLAYKIAGGVWTDLTTMSVSEGYEINRAITLPLNANGFCVYFTGVVDTGPNIDVSLSFGNTQIISTAAAHLLPGFQQQVIDNEISVGRVISMTCLITNTSSALANGGVITLARVPCAFDPFAADPGQAMSTLDASRVYSGPAATGGYMWWSPKQLEEMSLNNVGQMHDIYRGSDRLFAYLSGWPAGGSVRVVYTWTVEFYSPKQIFEKTLTPPMTQSYNDLTHSLSLMPSAMCNPTHIESLTAWVKAAASYANQGLQFYEEHKAIINTGLEMLAAL